MSKKWTIEEARAYISKVQKSKQPIGLTYCSAIDFLLKCNSNLSEIKEDENDNSDNIE